MGELFNLKIVTVDKELVNEEVKSFTTKNSDGEFQILSNHSPLITLTVPAKSTYVDKNNEKHIIFTSKGLIKLNNNDLIMIIANGENKNDIDRSRAEKSLERAKARLVTKDNIDVERATFSLERAVERIKVLDS